MRSSLPFVGTRWIYFPPASLSLLVAVAFAIAIPASASAAALSGRVTDPDGRAVPNALVVVHGPLGTVAEVRTGSTGEYDIPRLPDGRYDVHVVAEGFQALPESIVVAGDQRLMLPLRLRIGALQEAIVVSASQVQVARSEAPASLTVITAADLRARQIETVADALRDVPGLSVVRSGGRGALTSVFPRGGASNYTLVLIDGIRSNAFGGAFDFAHLSVANVDRIEIVRGPQSAQYGSEAIGAVVHIVTRRGGSPAIDGIVEGGSQETWRTMVGTSGSRGRLSWGFGAERVRSNGNAGRRIAGDTVDNDDYTRTQANGTVAIRTDRGVELTVAGSGGVDERGFPGPWGQDPIGVFPGIDRVSRGTNENGRIGARLSHPWGRRVRQRLEASYTDLSSTFVSSAGPSSSGTRRFDGKLQEDIALGSAAAVSVGGELVREEGRSTYVNGRAGTPIPIPRQSVGLFAETRVSATARLQITAGIRLDRLFRDAVDPDPTAFQPRPAFPRQVVGSLNPKVAATYLVTAPGSGRNVTRLRASAGTGIRPPDVFEIAFTDNPDLRPERSRSAELGLEQHMVGGAVVVDAAWFVNRYDDLIITVGRALDNASRYRTDNISNAGAQGLELSARAALPLQLQVGATYTRLSTEILSVDGLAVTAPPPFRVGDPLIRRPPHQGSLDVRYIGRRVSAFATLSSRGRMLDLEPNFGSFGGLFFSPGYAVVDIGGTLPLRRGLDLFARVNNVANRQYEETLGFPALGRTGVIGVRVAASR